MGQEGRTLPAFTLASWPYISQSSNLGYSLRARHAVPLQDLALVRAKLTIFF
jgi:hypothetical protein